MPPLADVEAAIDGLCTCVLLAEEERRAQTQLRHDRSAARATR